MKDVRKLLVGLAEFYGELLTPQRLGLYTEVISDLSADQVETAIKACLKDPQITRMPLPAKLRQMVKPTLSIDEATQELLGRCIQACTLYGYADPGGAARYMGAEVWSAFGVPEEWVRFCMAGDSLSGLNIGTARAQLREILRSKLSQKYPSGRIESLSAIGEGPKLRLKAPDPEQILADDEARRLGELTTEQKAKRVNKLMLQLADVLEHSRKRQIGGN